MPRVFSQRNRDAFAYRLSEYVKQTGLRHCVVVFHGGEPLLMGARELANFARQLRKAVEGDTQLDLSLQTNGLLITAEIIEEFKNADIGISLSLDGPKEANDIHRTSRKGRSSFDKTLKALDLLKAAPDLFAGVIAVIDPRVSPRTLFEFFAAHSVPKLDFLLPDAHHIRQPPRRQECPDIYERWLIEAFDLWLDEFPSLHVRTFEALLDCSAGLPSKTDAFGFGDVSLITVETDGTYHDLDVLKIVEPGATSIGGSVQDSPITQVARSPKLAAHRQLLRKDGLSELCQACEVVDICGGGSVPHRYGLRGFQNPTVYCREMRALIKHAQGRVIKELKAGPKSVESAARPYEGDLDSFECAECAAPTVDLLWTAALDDQVAEFRRALETFAADGNCLHSADARRLLEGAGLDELAQQPGAIAWSRAMLALASGRSMHAVDGSAFVRDGSYIAWQGSVVSTTEDRIKTHVPDPWLRLPFGNAVVFEEASVAKKAMPVLQEAYAIIEAWRPSLLAEMRMICRAVQFVRDPSAHPKKIVSFSDNSVPGALFVSVVQGDTLIDPYDLADSLIHEHRHQKLYLLERQYPVVDPTSMKVHSPWREELRPPSGLFHAIFVFVELRRFWLHVRRLGINRLHNRTNSQLEDTERNLRVAFKTLTTCPLTETGRRLASVLKAAM